MGILDCFMLAPFLIKGIALSIIIGLSSFVVEKFTYHEPEDDE